MRLLFFTSERRNIILDGFYCKECETEVEAPKHFRIPKITNPKQFTEIYICPNCKKQIKHNESEVTTK